MSSFCTSLRIAKCSHRSTMLLSLSRRRYYWGLLGFTGGAHCVRLLGCAFRYWPLLALYSQLSTLNSQLSTLNSHLFWPNYCVRVGHYGTTTYQTTTRISSCRSRDTLLATLCRSAHLVTHHRKVADLQLCAYRISGFAFRE